MSLTFKLAFIALFCAAFGHRIQVPSEGFASKPANNNVERDVPLKIQLLKVGDRFATFNITGKDTVAGLPITQLFVNYTIDGPTTAVKTEQLSYSNSNGIFQRVVQVSGFTPGLQYEMQFSGENSKQQKGPPSRNVTVLLLPPTPDITVLHPSIQKLKVIWGEKRSKNEDYYLLTVEKISALGCGLTVNLTSCFGNSYSLDDLEVGQVYRLTMMAHNPSGFSDPVVVSYPIE